METPDSLRARDYMGYTIVIYWGSPQEGKKKHITTQHNITQHNRIEQNRIE